MKRALIGFAVLALIGLLASFARAQTANPGNLPGATVSAHCSLTFTSVVNLFTACVAAGTSLAAMQGATWAMIDNEGAAYRYWSDGTTATTASGMAVPGGSASAPTYMALSAGLSLTSIVPQSGTTILMIEFIR